MILDVNGDYLLRDRESERYLPLNRDLLYSEIQRILSEHGIPESGIYALNSPDADERLSIYEDGKFWVISYSERGRRVSPAFFDGAFDAANYFIWKLISEVAGIASLPRFKLPPDGQKG